MPVDPNRVKDLFQAALELTEAPARQAFVDRECGADQELRARLVALLSAHDAPATVINQALPPVVHSPADVPGTIIAGKYKLLQQIGEGGMGTVWMADQLEPVKRRVAVKLILTGLYSREVQRRFEQERQALALMDHPHIARVLDGGLTGDGRPFFVMELVNGLALTNFCDQVRLGIRERLEIFVLICQAVQHAHQKGIVHRDLKPSNILVTIIDGRPVPKVIDFGVAKATEGKLLEQTLTTHFGAIVGTLEYMAPEQAGYSGADIDTRADIYSLGVILYELLTGLKPFDSRQLQDGALAELIRIIREEEPLRPSTRLSTDDARPSLAALRQVDPGRLQKLLRGELDWVVMKCLEKQRDRRYATANALAREIQCYLADEPVEARPPSPAYRLRKVLSRHRGPVLAAGVIACALIAGIVGTTLGLLSARKHERDALGAKAEYREQRDLAIEHERAATRNQELAESRADSLRRALARHSLEAGIHEFDAGFPDAGLGLLMQARALTAATDPWSSSLQTVLIDRATQGGRQLLPPLLHAGGIQSCAISPDGGYLITAVTDDRTGRLQVWDARTGMRVGSSWEVAGQIRCIDFHPDGRTVATAGTAGDGTGWAQVWQFPEGRPAGPALRPAVSIACLEYSPDGSTLATADYSGAVQLWNPGTARLKHASAPLGHWCRCLRFSPDGHQVVAGFQNGLLTVTNVDAGATITTAHEHQGAIIGIDFFPNGQQFATASWDFTVRFWDPRSGQPTGVVLHNERRGFTGLAFDPDGTRLVTGDGDNRIQLWDLQTSPPQRLRSVVHDGEPDSSSSQSMLNRLEYSADGLQLLSVAGRSARLWTAEGLTPIGDPFRHSGEIATASFSPNGRWIATGGTEGAVRLWSGIPQRQIPPPLQPAVPVRLVARSASGADLAIATEDQIAVYKTAHGKQVGSITDPEPPVYRVAVSPDSSQVAHTSGDDWFSISLVHNTRGRASRIVLPDHVTCLNFIPQTTALAVCTKSRDDSRESETLVQVWDDRPHWRVTREFRIPGWVSKMAMSPDGTRFAALRGEVTTFVRDIQSGQPIGLPLSHAREILAVAFSPDGNQIATAGEDRTVRIWSSATGLPLAGPLHHSSAVTQLAFSQDGTWLLTGTRSHGMRTWDLNLGVSVGAPIYLENDGTGATSLALFHGDRQVVWVQQARLLACELEIPPDGSAWNELDRTLPLWTGHLMERESVKRPLTSDEHSELKQELGNLDPVSEWMRQTHFTRHSARLRDECETAWRTGNWRRLESVCDTLIQCFDGAQTERGRLAFSQAALKADVPGSIQALEQLGGENVTLSWAAAGWYRYAEIYARASARDTEKQQEYADQAVRLLQRAVQLGYRDVTAIASEPGFAAVRQQSGFRELIETLRRQSARKQHWEAAAALVADNRPEAALVEFRVALSLQDPATDRHVHRRDQVPLIFQYGYALLRSGQGEEAEEQFDLAVRIREMLAGENPDSQAEGFLLGAVYDDRAKIYRDSQQFAAADAWFQRAIVQFQNCQGRWPDRVVAARLRNSLWEHAQVLQELGRPAEAISRLSQAIAITTGPRVTRFRVARVLANLRIGNVRAALEEAEDLRDLNVSDSAVLYDLACAYALVSGRESADIERHALIAIDCLRGALAAGFRDLEHLRIDADLDPLRQRDDFRQLLNEIDSRQSPPAGR